MTSKPMFHIVKTTKTIVTTEEFRNLFNAERRAWEINDAEHSSDTTVVAEIITIEDQKAGVK